MKDKKVIIAIILCIGAVISLIYGITSQPKAKKQVSPRPEVASIEEQVLSPIEHIMPIKRRTARTNFASWGRNPFAPEEISAEVVAKLVLNGIMWDDKRPLAIINNDVVGIGGKIGEYTVVDIKKDSVILNNGTGDLELRLAQ